MRSLVLGPFNAVTNRLKFVPQLAVIPPVLAVVAIGVQMEIVVKQEVFVKMAQDVSIKNVLPVPAMRQSVQVGLPGVVVFRMVAVALLPVVGVMRQLDHVRTDPAVVLLLAPAQAHPLNLLRVAPERVSLVSVIVVQ